MCEDVQELSQVEKKNFYSQSVVGIFIPVSFLVPNHLVDNSLRTCNELMEKQTAVWVM